MRTSIFSILTCTFLFSISCNSNLSEDNKNDNEINYKEITNIPDCNCEDKPELKNGYEVIKVLKDEPAFINKRCMDYKYFNEDGFVTYARIDTFCINLVNMHTEFFSLGGLFPCGEIPEQYRKDGLSVYISGNVTSVSVAGGGSEPNNRIASIPVFELKAIKINNNKK